MAIHIEAGLIDPEDYYENGFNSWLESLAEEDEKEEQEQRKRERELYREVEWVFDGKSYLPSSKLTITKRLPAGFYTVIVDSNRNLRLAKEDLSLDDVYRFPDPTIDNIVDEIGRFWNKKDKFKEHGLVHKRGILMVGPPGTGKTSIINLLTHDLIKNGGIVFHVSTHGDLNLLTQILESIRDIEPDRPVITVIEDIDNLFGENQSKILSFLDGEDQVEHHVVIATSNRLHELNDLLLRPSRFDWVVEVNAPKEEVRRFYLEKKGIQGEELDKWVKATNEFNVAQLKELFIAVKLLDNDFDDVIEKLVDQSEMVQNTTYHSKKRGAGFGSSRK